MAVLVCWFHAMAGYTGHLIKILAFYPCSSPLPYMLLDTAIHFVLSFIVLFRSGWFPVCLHLLPSITTPSHILHMSWRYWCLFHQYMNLTSMNERNRLPFLAIKSYVLISPHPDRMNSDRPRKEPRVFSSTTTTSSPSIPIQHHKKQKLTSSIMPTYPTLSRDETIANLPSEYPSDALNQISTYLSSSSTSPRRLVVLDDDPTGTQTCHDISVLTVWDIPTLAAEFRSSNPGFFILTNSRALPPSSAKALIQEICQNVVAAATATGYSKDNLDIVLRGDSTLRGHFPLEVDVAQAVLGFDAGAPPTWVLAPFFFQGGRFTIDDVHYVLEGEKLVPAGETQFARDATFGYKSSNLRDYVLEKAPGRFSTEQVHTVSLEDIRRGGPEAVCERLLGFPKGGVVIANAAAESDMHVFVAGLLLGMSCFCFRCGFCLICAY